MSSLPWLEASTIPNCNLHITSFYKLAPPLLVIENTNNYEVICLEEGECIMRRWFMLHKKSNQKINNQLSPDVSMRKNAPCVLLAEDDYDMRKLLALSLRKYGYEVIECTDGLQLLDYLYLGSFSSPEKTGAFNLIISDIRMPGFTGLEVLEGWHQYEACPPMVLITAFGDEEIHAQAYKYGAAAIFDKPFDIDDLLAKVQEIVPPSLPV